MEAAVANTPITERQRFWRDHVLAAAAYSGTIVEYAKAQNLKTKDIYQWKTSLTKRGLMDNDENEIKSDFVAVTQIPAEQEIQEKGKESVKLRLTLSCGTRIEFFSANDCSVGNP